MVGLERQGRAEPPLDLSDIVSPPWKQFVAYQVFHFIYSTFLRKSTTEHDDLTGLTKGLLRFFIQSLANPNTWKPLLVFSCHARSSIQDC